MLQTGCFQYGQNYVFLFGIVSAYSIMTKFEFPFVLEVGEIHYVYNSISFDTKKGIETLVLNK